jgi:hypothetical protein
MTTAKVDFQQHTTIKLDFGTHPVNDVLKPFNLKTNIAYITNDWGEVYGLYQGVFDFTTGIFFFDGLTGAIIR